MTAESASGLESPTWGQSTVAGAGIDTEHTLEVVVGQDGQARVKPLEGLARCQTGEGGQCHANKLHLDEVHPTVGIHMQRGRGRDLEDLESTICLEVPLIWSGSIPTDRWACTATLFLAFVTPQHLEPPLFHFCIGYGCRRGSEIAPARVVAGVDYPRGRPDCMRVTARASAQSLPELPGRRKLSFLDPSSSANPGGCE